MKMQATYQAKTGEIKPKWWLIDASNQSLGRMCTQIATLLRGRHRPEFTPHVDTGDFVVVVNCKGATMTGRKWTEKMYHDRSRFFGKVHSRSASQMREHKPDRIIREAVWGMLPKNRLSRNLIKKLKIYADGDHPHAAQKLEIWNLKN